MNTKEFLKKYILTWDFLFSSATSGGAIIIGIIAFLRLSTIDISTSESNTPVTLKHLILLKDFLIMIVFMAVLFVIYIKKSSLNTYNKIENAHTKPF